MPDCELRQPTAEDTQAVYALICELKQREYDREAFRHAWMARLAEPSQRYQLAVLNGNIVGLIGLQIQFPLHQMQWVAEVQELVVMPQARSQQVGSRLLAWAEDEARRSGATAMELSSGKVREDAHRFYRREGYAQSHFRFKKALSPA